MPRWRLALGLLALAAYVAASHWLTVHAAAERWSLAAFAAPLWIAAALAALRARSRSAGVGLTAVAALIAAVVANGGLGDIQHLYLLQHAGVHLLLGLWFVRSLRGGRTPAITAVAARVHRSLSAPMRDYCRKVTAVWAVYFGLMTLLSLAVYRLFSLAAWSTLANIVTPLAIGALFVGEFVLRYRLHPDFERASLLDAARAYQQGASR